ncbi:MAG: hypothetical protein P8Y29_03050 [Gemmatimonadota bacterium]
MSRYVNCGTLMALAGLGVFALLGYALFQILCYGAGGAGVGSLRYPG